MTINMKPEERETYERRFQAFLFKIIDVAKFKPKERHIYPIMDGVPFRDLEVSLDMALLERKKLMSNDNQK